AELPGKTGIWMSGNHGENPKELVTSTEGTKFGPIVFAKGGGAIFYGAHKGSDYSVVQLDLETGTAGTAWTGPGPIVALTEGEDIAVTAGPCRDRAAVLGGREREEKIPLLAGKAA